MRLFKFWAVSIFGMTLILAKKKLSDLLQRVLWSMDCMSDRSRIRVDLVIISTNVGLVAKEVNLLETLLLDVSQCVRLIPASREHVKGKLSADRVG